MPSQNTLAITAPPHHPNQTKKHPNPTKGASRAARQPNRGAPGALAGLHRGHFVLALRFTDVDAPCMARAAGPRRCGRARALVFFCCFCFLKECRRAFLLSFPLVVFAAPAACFSQRLPQTTTTPNDQPPQKTTGLTLWVFSGDVDGIVPVLGSRRWVEGLRLPVLTPWRPWSSATGQVKGRGVIGRVVLLCSVVRGLVLEPLQHCPPLRQPPQPTHTP